MSATFEVDSQSGHTINNIGGNQHVHVSQARRRLALVGKGMAVLGFVAVLASLVAIGVAAWTTTEAVLDAVSADTLGGDYTAYAPAWWPVPLASLLGALVLGRLGRLLTL